MYFFTENVKIEKKCYILVSKILSYIISYINTSVFN